jgi:uncharacterized protein (TIRG00374 family)
MRGRIWIGLSISLVCLPLVLLQVDFTVLSHTLQSVHYLWFLPALCLLFPAYALKTWRWQCILTPVQPLPWLSLLSALAIGSMANMLLPAHAGEVIRAYVLQRRHQLQLMATLSTVVIERLADSVSILLLLALYLLVSSRSAAPALLVDVLKLGGAMVVLVSIAVGSIWLLAFRTARMLHLVQTSCTCLPLRWRTRLATSLATFATGLQSLRQGTQLLRILGLSLLQWLVLAVHNMCILHATGLVLPLYDVALLVVVEVLGVLLPSAPGFIGTYHAAVVAGLRLLGVPHEQALSAAILLHAAFFVPYIIVGWGFLWRESLSLAALCSAQHPG